MKGPRRVTQQDIARAAGVGRSTVSMALQNHPGIPEATRRRIRACAKRLGYRPDPMLSALASYRAGLRPAEFHGTLAWLAHKTVGNANWRRVGTHYGFYCGARRKAQQHGYRLEIFEIDAEAGMTAERISSVLRARNVAGIVVAPQPKSDMRLDFPWRHFSAIALGYTLRQPQLHLAASSIFGGMEKLMNQILALGYRRIGFAIWPEHDKRVAHHYLAAYDLRLKLAGLSLSIPHFKGEESVARIRAWALRHRLDAVVTGVNNPAFFSRWMDLPPPRIGIASMVVMKPGGLVSGMHENALGVGEAAVEFLVAMIRRGERGVPATPHRLLVDGEWNPGKTLPAAKARRRQPAHP